MVNPKEAIFVVAVFGLGVAYAINSVSEEDNRIEETAKRLEVIERSMAIRPVHPSPQALRQAAYEASRPCGGVITWIPAHQWPNEYPDQVWCDTVFKHHQQRAIEAKVKSDYEAEQMARKMPVGDMFDCAYDYSGMVLRIDTVDSPQSHNSWVMGGVCEDVAHELRDTDMEGEVWNVDTYALDDPKLLGMCLSFSDDSPIQAHKCQTEMRRWLEVYCWNATEDDAIRACRRVSLGTPTADSDPFVP